MTIYPMKKIAKAPKEQSTAVCLVEWGGAEDDLQNTKWLFVKRPDKGRFRDPGIQGDQRFTRQFLLAGLLAGLFEPPSIVIDSGLNPKERLDMISGHTAMLFSAPQEVQSTVDALKTTKNHGYLQDYVHVFSHIRMTYHVHRLRLETPKIPQLSSFETETIWLNMDEIAAANVTTGTKNILKALYDPPHLQDTKKKKASTTARKPKAKAVPPLPGQKVVKIIKMPGS